jgi:hypothetical protein
MYFAVLQQKQLRGLEQFQNRRTMNPNLAQALLSKGVIRMGTVIQAYQHVKSLSCVCNSSVIVSYIITRARLVGGKRVLFDAVNPEQIRHVVESEQVVMVDGMLIDRLAYSHNLSMDGIDVTRRTRRGRRKHVA